MTDAGITLYFSRGKQSLKVSLIEGYQKALRPYEVHRPAWEQIEKASSEIFAILRRANRTVGPTPEIIAGLQKSGQILFDLLIPPQAKDKLAVTLATVLTLQLEDNLVHLPWELLHDGRDFLCRRFAVGRIAGTCQAPTARSSRALQAPFKVLIIADPRGDLEAGYREGLELKAFLDRKRDVFQVDFKSHPADIAFVKNHIRDYDIVHYAGHANYDPANTSSTGWLLSDGICTAAEFAAMGGFQPMPALLFCNACRSGQSDPWKSHDEIFGLANAFLLAGVQDFVGTFSDLVDESGLRFARYFYESIAKGEAIGTALRAARHAFTNASGDGSLVWANYMLYGEPSIEFSAGKREGLTRTGGVGWKRIFHDRTPAKSLLLVLLLAVLGAVSIYEGYSLLSRPLQPVTERAPNVAANSGASATGLGAVKAAPLSLSMNIIALKKEPDERYSEVIVKEGSVLNSGDHFQVHLEPNGSCYLYVLLLDSHGQASQLFPDPKIETPGFINATHKITVPDKDSWFWLDQHPGIETVYSLASPEPLTDMRGLLHKMAEAGGAERSPSIGRADQHVDVAERGVGGTTKSRTVLFPHSDNAQLQRVKKVTEVVASTGAVVRAISFEHR